jgi:tetratricopeptide (TPR) repeat protein
MTTSALNKFLSIFSLASIATTILGDPAFARPIVHRGDKGTYTIDAEAGTYRGCLNSGGCISLGRKYLIKSSNSESTDIRWKNGEYIYEISEGGINVSQNGRLIFQDRTSIDSSEVSQVDPPRLSKAQKLNKVTRCLTFSSCTQAINDDPQNSYTYLSRAKFYKGQSQIEKALIDCDKAIEIDSQNFDAYLIRANFKRSNYNWFSNKSEILSDYDRAIEINSQNSDAYLERSILKYKINLEINIGRNNGWNNEQAQEILNDLDRAIAINTQNSDAYLIRGDIRRRQKKVEEALKDCRLAKKYAFNSNNPGSSEQCVREIESGG